MKKSATSLFAVASGPRMRRRETHKGGPVTGTKKTAAIGILTAVVCAAGIMLTSTQAQASFHLMKITEIYAGSGANLASQFIELQMYSSGQNLVGGQSVDVYNAAGTKTDTFTFSGNVSNAANQAHILVATTAAQGEFGVGADLTMTQSLNPGGGKVCWAGTIDCASWGSYSGSATGTGTPFNAPDGIPPGSSMTRIISGGSNASQLDAGDDTGQSASDFTAAGPTPVNNAATSGTTTTAAGGTTTTAGSTTTTAGGGTTTTTLPTGSTTTTTMPPGPPRVSRTVSLRFRDGKLKGRLTSEGAAGCSAVVPIKLQRKSGGEWNTVAGKKTGLDGRYAFDASHRSGRFRTKAPEVTMKDAVCLAARSPALVLD
ncbi:MAG: hypothetical protein QOH90_297 [Actinomycetota bacterium]|nr:hypothetical protein [Actinomycetota bacterium]